MKQDEKSFFDYDEIPKVAYSPDLARAVGDLKAAIYLSQLIYYLRTFRPMRGRKPLWSQEDFERDTALTRHEQDRARGYLKKCGLIFERAGVGFKKERIIDVEALEKLFPACHKAASQLATNQQASLPQTVKQLATNRQASLPQTGKPSYEIREKKEQSEKPGPVQADLAFSDSDEIVRLFDSNAFPWQKDKGEEA